ncbi:MAG TPA: protoglobin domain-containing protein [Dissulfurispiraceae bacterium]|nr:protoglobin domain-containing protein [Dissulfurispiraceae bacterium]
MRSCKEIKSHYYFTDEDVRALVSVRQLMIEQAGRVMGRVDEWIQSLPESAKLFSDESQKKHVAAMRQQWFIDLFSGVYDSKYLEKIIRIGQTHVRFGVEAHFMNRTINLVRTLCIEILHHNVEDDEERTRIFISIEKILDINLDVITSSYIDAELRTHSPEYRIRSLLVTYTEKFAQAMNFVLVFALVGLTIGVIWLFVNDLINIASDPNFSHGIITALGSLLILWVMIELMNTEIKHLKGGKFRISVFVGVALVAFIRDTMIKALRHENMQEMYYLIPLILTLGVVFWLVTKSEERNL